MESLTRQPTRCPRAPESDRFPEELRELLHGKGRGKHRIIFTIRDQDIVVLHIHHSARKELEP